MVYWPIDHKCYTVLTKGPCLKGNLIVLNSDGIGECQVCIFEISRIVTENVDTSSAIVWENSETIIMNKKKAAMNISRKVRVKKVTCFYLTENVIAMTVYLTIIPTMINVMSWVSIASKFYHPTF